MNAVSTFTPPSVISQWLEHVKDGTVASDLTETAKVLIRLKEQRNELSLVIAEVEAHVAELLRSEPNGQAEVAGVGVLKRHAGKERKAWNHELLWERVRNEAKGCACRKVDQSTGELESDVEHVTRHYRDCAGVARWKVGGLKPLGIDPDEYATVSWGRATVEVIN